MFSNTQKLYLRSKAATARWSTAHKAITAYTVVPTGVSVWEFMQTSNLKLLFAYLIIVVAIVFLKVLCADREAHYQGMVDLLKTRLDHPPNKSEDLTDGQNSTKLSGETKDGNPG